MKNIKLTTLITLLFMVLVFPLSPVKAAGDTNGNRNQLRVRVFEKGKPVTDLHKEDFQLDEDKTLQTLENVVISTKKIGGPPQTSSPARFFVLLFNITDFDSQLQKGLAVIFNDMLGVNDQLLVNANEQTLFSRNLTDKEKARQDVEKFLAEQAKQARVRMFADLNTVEKLMNLVRTRSSRETQRNGQGAVHLHYYMKYIKFSIEQYISALQAYKKKYFTLDFNNCYYLLKPLETLDREKWLIRFYQMPEIPELSAKNRDMVKKLISDLQNSTMGDEIYYSELFTNMLSRIDDTFNAVHEFPTKNMIRLFYNLDATFHSLVLAGGNEKISHDQKYRRLLTDIERHLAEIALRTGGVQQSLVSSSAGAGVSLEAALATIRDREDVNCSLVFSPLNPGKQGKLSVEVNKKNWELVYEDPRETADISQYLEKKDDPQTPTVHTRDAAFKNKNLSLTIAGFMLPKEEKNSTGRIVVRIYIKDIQNHWVLFDQSKTMLPQKDTIHLSLQFPWLSKGNYETGIDVNDLLTGKRSLELVTAAVD